MEIFGWLAEHWDEILQVYAFLIAAASVIVKWTPTLKDDHALKSIIRFVGKFIALNRK